MSVTKVFVGVHGIGDQTRCETIQTIIERVSSYQGTVIHVPLGKICSALKTLGVFECADLAAPGNTIAVSEVYWADIPRRVVKRGHVLEESTQWAGTLVEKLNREYVNQLAPADKEAIASILPEAIESVRVLKRLSLVAEWGLKFKFDLNGLLEDYLGDVQFVTEFEQQRNEIVQRFHSAMSAAWDKNKTADVYIIAHSEGTVVAFLGLLEALSSEEKPQWLDNVKGFMTFGSPIDKHLILWPELWKDLKGSWPSQIKISWNNYYDYGDPVGFELNAAKTWLGSAPPFVFSQDMGYARYLLPGKAHVDYWKDEALFADFLASAGIARSSCAEPIQKLHSRSLAGAVSCVIPYILSFGLLLAGVLFFYNTIIVCTAENVNAMLMLRDSLAFSALLTGIGVAARIPRLIRDFRWHLWSLAMALLFYAYFWFTVNPEVCRWLAEPLCFPEAHSRDTMGCIALGVLLLSYLYNLFSRHSGVWFMVTAGSLAAFSLVIANIMDDVDHKEIFPVLVGAVAFLYLWWLSVLVFDLSFIWHQYIRKSLALHRMQECFNNKYRQPFVSQRIITPTKVLVAASVERGAAIVSRSVEFTKKILTTKK
jgi:ABC-type multidrug transport system fused ATPase/permease subunit